MIWPLNTSPVITAGWNYPDGTYHGAIDLRAVVGTPVVAAAPGEVIWLQYWDGKTLTGNQSYGNAVKLKHSDGSFSLYAHLNTISCKMGQWIELNQALGYSGNTGHSTGPHLHFEVRGRSNTRLQPLNYLDSNFICASDAVKKNLGNYKSMSGYGNITTSNDRDTANWDKDDNRFVVEASKGDRAKLKEAIDSLKLPVYDYRKVDWNKVGEIVDDFYNKIKGMI